MESIILNICKSVKERISDSSGECFSASFALGIKLAIAGLPSTLIEGICCNKKHWWLEVRGFIVDITADQFGLAPIIIERNNPNYKKNNRKSPDFESIAIYLGNNI